jgi:hypothetical protein
VFIGASDAPATAMTSTCKTVASEIVDWRRDQHRIEWVEQVEAFPTLRHAKSYAQWLKREGAFEGHEHYAMGLDAALA